MSWTSTLGLITLVALALPVITIIVLRLATYRTFPALMIGLLLTFSVNFLDLGFVNAPKWLLVQLNFWNNILDAPLILLFLTYLSFSPQFAKRIKIGIGAYLVFEAVVIFLYGMTNKTLSIVMGPGLAMVFAICLGCFIRHTKITIMHRKASGKAIISAALLFGYGCFFLIYLMFYVVRTPHVADTYLVYYLSSIFSSLLLAAGILIERKRVQKLNELMVTRKELSAIYKNGQPSTAPYTAAMLDFDREQLN